MARRRSEWGFENDPSGTAAKRRYSEVSSVPAEKYDGSGHAVHQIDQTMCTNDSEFVWRASSWSVNLATNYYETKTLQVQLGVGASDFSNGILECHRRKQNIARQFSAGQEKKRKKCAIGTASLGVPEIGLAHPSIIPSNKATKSARLPPAGSRFGPCDRLHCGYKPVCATDIICHLSRRP